MAENQKFMRSSLGATFKKTASLVDRTTHFKAIFILIIIIIGVALETASIGLLFPFIKLLIDPSGLNAISAYLPSWTFENVEDGNTALVTLSILILIMFIVKNCALLLIYYAQATFTLQNMQLLSTRLYDFYLNSPYSLHLTRNSSELIQNIHAASSSALVGSFMGFLAFFSELLLVLAVIILLLAIDPVMTFAAGSVLGTSVGLAYLLLRSRIQYWGERTLKVEKAMLKSLQQGLHSIKEITVLGREDFLLKDYKRPLNEYVRLITAKQVMVQAPRLWIESVTLCTIMAIIIYALTTGNSAASILPVLTVFGAAALRLIPSLNRIVVALNRINDAKHSVDVVYQDLANLDTIRADKQLDDNAFTQQLEMDSVTFQYAPQSTPAIKDVSFTLKKGESLGIVGPSGSGKSTIVDLLLGLLTPTSGRILVDGQDISECPRAWQSHLGYVPQSIYLIDNTIRRNIALGVEDQDINHEQIDAAIRHAKLDDFIASLPSGLDTNADEHGVRLSGGQRQRVGIARALYNNPDIIVFDEATSALDSRTEKEVSHAIESLSREKTLIIIAHRLSTVRHCDQLILLKDGQIEDIGTFDELALNNSSFRELVAHSQL